jgi:hypothetical protein
MNGHRNIKTNVMYMILLFAIQQAHIGNEYKNQRIPILTNLMLYTSS